MAQIMEPTKQEAAVSDALHPLARTTSKNAMSYALAQRDTPLSTAPSSPRIRPTRQNTGNLPRKWPTTLDIPGLTKSKVSPDGRIAQRDIGAKLIIVMVGLPARGKSYITKKISRYLNWLQHDTRIFNVGERRRVVANQTPTSAEEPKAPVPPSNIPGLVVSSSQGENSTLNSNTNIVTNGGNSSQTTISRDFAQTLPLFDHLPLEENMSPSHHADNEPIKHDAEFFNPKNQSAKMLREQLALDTLDDLLDFLLLENGAVGIFDATNSTIKRREALVSRIRSRAGLDLNVLFLESVCEDEQLLESNMRLKLSGPDYRDQDPVKALIDFRQRVRNYESAYETIGQYEEKNNIPYVKMIDVGRKVVSHQIRGFLSSQTVYYLLNFNLAPRQIWISRHGESLDNLGGKLGGDSGLSPDGTAYARALALFIKAQRATWDIREQERALRTHFPPHPGDHTPPNPDWQHGVDQTAKSFLVWTSMMRRGYETAQFFDEEDFDIKQMRMMDELNAGSLEGLTFDAIKAEHRDEYERRKADKLHYRYPGPGGEGYLDIINRLKPVILEVERTTDHVLLIGHRSVARVLLAYFLGHPRDDVAKLDVPPGIIYALEPKPYGVQFKAYRHNPLTQWFDELPDFQIVSARE